MFKDILKKYYYYLLIITAYCIVPYLVFTYTGTVMFILLLYCPLLILIISFLYARNNGFKWYFSLIVGFLWIFNIVIFFNDTATFYIWYYMAFSLVGQFIGVLFKNKS